VPQPCTAARNCRTNTGQLGGQLSLLPLIFLTPSLLLLLLLLLAVLHTVCIVALCIRRKYHGLPNHSGRLEVLAPFHIYLLLYVLLLLVCHLLMWNEINDDDDDDDVKERS